MHILAEERNFKTFLKEDCAVAFGQLLLIYEKNVEHGIEHDTDSVYGV